MPGDLRDAPRVFPEVADTDLDWVRRAQGFFISIFTSRSSSRGGEQLEMTQPSHYSSPGWFVWKTRVGFQGCVCPKAGRGGLLRGEAPSRAWRERSLNSEHGKVPCQLQYSLSLFLIN